MLLLLLLPLAFTAITVLLGWGLRTLCRGWYRLRGFNPGDGLGWSRSGGTDRALAPALGLVWWSSLAASLLVTLFLFSPWRHVYSR